MSQPTLQQLFAARTIRDAFVADAWEGHKDPLTLDDVERLANVAFDAIPIARPDLTPAKRLTAIGVIFDALVKDAWEGHSETLRVADLDRMASVALNAIPTKPVARADKDN